jgi:lysine N6-hydroxylase
LVNDLIDTNNGITLDLLDSIYRRAYELRFIEKSSFELVMLSSHTFHTMKKLNGCYEVTLLFQTNSQERVILSDSVIFCTGYEKELPSILSPLYPKLKEYHPPDYQVNADFSLPWLHESTNKIYLQNAASHCFGLGDTNLGIFSWRNAIIINSLLGETYYPVVDSSLLLPMAAKNVYLPQHYKSENTHDAC